MLFAVKLGPIETTKGEISAYVGFTEAGIVQPAFRRRDADGLKHLARQVYGEELRCEATLAGSGAPLGFATAPVPEWVVPMRAGMALGIALGPLLGPEPDMDLLFDFAVAATEFWHGAPFSHWHDGQPIEVEIHGAIDRKFEAAILGFGGAQHGIALYKRKGAVQRAARLMDRSRVVDAARLEAMAVTLDDTPAFAIEPLRAAFDLPLVPHPFGVREGEPGPITQQELAALTAVLRAASELSPVSLESEGAVRVGGWDASAKLRAPEPAGAPG